MNADGYSDFEMSEKGLVNWLDKRTRRVCFSISSEGLAITGVDDRRYWSRIETAESR